MHAELWRRRLSKEVKSAKDSVHRQRGTNVGDQSSSGKRSGSGHMVISVVNIIRECLRVHSLPSLGRVSLSNAVSTVVSIL